MLFRSVTVALLLLVVALAHAKLRFESHKGEITSCNSGRQYNVRYSMVAVAAEHFSDLDAVVGLDNVVCGFDKSRLLLEFSDSQGLINFLDNVTLGETFLTSFSKYTTCNGSDPSASGIIIRRVIAVNLMNNTETQVELQAVPARYDEVIQDSDISLGTTGTCEDEIDQPICLGVNTNDCKTAAAPISIYTNQYLNLACSNCFVGFDADVFLTLKMRWFKLHELGAGFQNMQLNAATVMDLNAHAAWSTGIDKTIEAIKQTTIVAFRVGPIPFRFWFELPVEVKASASFQATAEATAGATFNVDIGTLSLEWTPDTKWVLTKPNPTSKFNTVLSGSAEFNGNADFAVVPSILTHVDNIFDYSVTFTPDLHMEIQGSTSSKQICASATYELSLDSVAALHIDVDWLHIHDDRTITKVLYDSGVVDIGKTCVGSN